MTKKLREGALKAGLFGAGERLRAEKEEKIVNRINQEMEHKGLVTLREFKLIDPHVYDGLRESLKDGSLESQGLINELETLGLYYLGTKDPSERMRVAGNILNKLDTTLKSCGIDASAKETKKAIPDDDEEVTLHPGGG